MTSGVTLIDQIEREMPYGAWPRSIRIYSVTLAVLQQLCSGM